MTKIIVKGFGLCIEFTTLVSIIDSQTGEVILETPMSPALANEARKVKRAQAFHTEERVVGKVLELLAHHKEIERII